MREEGNNNQKEEVLTLQEVAKKLRIGTHNLRKLVKCGVLRPIRLVSINPEHPPKCIHLKFTHASIEAFLNNNTINHQGDAHEPF